MTLRAAARSAVEVLLIVALVSLLLGQAIGQPILLGYVTTDSMESEIAAGDGFVVVPTAVTGDVEEGDVVVFEAQQLHGGGLTTHRVVDRTPEGYVTKGDNNPFTDQDGGEPPVSDRQIRAKALQVGGSVVTIPHLGTAVDGVRGVVTDVTGTASSSDSVGGVLLVAGAVLFVVAGLTGAKKRPTTRERSRPNVLDRRLLFGLLLLVVVVPTTAAMTMPSGTTEYAVLGAEQTGDDPLIVEPGGETTVEYRIANDGMVPTVAVVDPASDGVTVADRRATVESGGTATTDLTLQGPATQGVTYRDVSERRYVAVLPAGLLVALHDIHPWVAIAAVDGVVVSAVTLLVALGVGLRDQRLRSAGSDRSVTDRLRRRLGL
ncbi:signal peptidase I [Halostella litorea]|uniref:signal peptidase I n=1 Tax=Halostella litorea TaxID=2528831 RepID=UPI00109300E6|nr:signal peptidase I [Halostella litorea]